MRILWGSLVVAVFALVSLPFQARGQINPGSCGSITVPCYIVDTGGGGSSVQIAPGTGLNAAVAPANTAPTAAQPALVVAISQVMTFQGTLAVTTSAALSTLTLSNGTTWPAALGKLTVINVGAGSGYICWFGGTCAATGGSELLAGGASDTVYLGGATTSPTAFSTAGTTLAIHN